MNLADRNGGNNGVFTERAAAHEVEQGLPFACETTCTIRHEALTLSYSVQVQFSSFTVQYVPTAKIVQHIAEHEWKKTKKCSNSTPIIRPRQNSNVQSYKQHCRNKIKLTRSMLCLKALWLVKLTMSHGKETDHKLIYGNQILKGTVIVIVLKITISIVRNFLHCTDANSQTNCYKPYFLAEIGFGILTELAFSTLWHIKWNNMIS